jgi:hypothetical protein
MQKENHFASLLYIKAFSCLSRIMNTEVGKEAFYLDGEGRKKQEIGQEY